MVYEKVNFIGLLSNVDSSILMLTLDHGFKIEATSEEEGTKFLLSLEGLDSMPIFHISRLEFQNKVSFELSCKSIDSNFYIVKNSLVDTHSPDPYNFSSELNQVNQFHKELIIDYLSPTLRLMRLFKEGDIRMPLMYYYWADAEKHRLFSKHFSLNPVSHELFKLEQSEISEISDFIHLTKLPFEKSFLQLAFENFELSYNITNASLSFLALMVSLETLLNPSDNELSYRLSRNTAVLLGKDREHAKSIFSEVRDLYNKRSKIVHSGRTDAISTQELLKLRRYVRESIKAILRIGDKKEVILDLLNSHGFGERI